ncbi:MAG: hypothetical protein K0Q72_4175, partial [Armatimonadetes bacterium]|nr:hypothetical protein [Armatimonadota bacterium]
VLILPLIRPWGYQAGLVEVMVLLLGLIALAPYLGLAVLTFRLMNRRCAGWGGAWAAAAVVGWATWTDLSLPTLLSLRAHELVPLQGRVVWALSTQLWRSPLEVPGWPLAWLGGAIWAGLAVRAILGPVSPGPGFGTDRPQRRPARPGSE